jgi:hypothetical protein
MKIKRTTLETLAKLAEKATSKDSLRHTLTQAHLFGMHEGRRELVAYASDGVKAVRFESLPDAQEGPLAEILEQRPLLVSREHAKLIKSVLKASYKLQEEFDARLEDNKLLVKSGLGIGSEGIEVTCGYLPKQSGEYLEQSAFERLFRIDGTVAKDTLGNAGLVIRSNTCPTLAFNAELLADIQDVLLFDQKTKGITLTLAQEQTLGKDGSQCSTSRMMVKPLSVDAAKRIGVLCGMRASV